MIYKQLILAIEEKLNYNFENYDWLIGNPDNLRIFFREKLMGDISQKLKNDCIKRLRELGANYDI